MAIIQLTKSRYTGTSKDIKPKDAAYGASFYEYDTERIYDRALDYVPNNGWKLRATSGGTGGGFSMEEIQAMISTFIATTGGIEHQYSDESNSFLIFLNEDIKTKLDFIEISENIDLDAIKSDVETNNSKNSYPTSASNKVNNLPTDQNQINTNQSDINIDIEQRVAANDAKESYPGPQDLTVKQDVLINGGNIKSINGISILGSGDLTVTGVGGTVNNFNNIYTDKGSDNLIGAMDGSNRTFTVSAGEYQPGSLSINYQGQIYPSLSSAITETNPNNGTFTVNLTPLEIESGDEFYVTYLKGTVTNGDINQTEGNSKTVYFSDYGAVADTGVDQSTALNALIADHVAGNIETVVIEKGKYNLTSTIDWLTLDGLTVVGENGAWFESNQQIVFNFPQANSITNSKFINLKVTTTDSTPTTNGAHAVFYFNKGNIDNLEIKYCEVSAPNSATNGMKWLASGTTVQQNIKIEYNYIHDTEAMSMEWQNHVPADELPRFKNIYIANNRFINSSTTISDRGMGTSFSGWMQDLVLENNTYIGHPNRAMEGLALENAVITKNKGETNGSFMVMTENPVATLRPSRNIIFTHNISIGNPTGEDGKDGMYFINVENLTFNDNILEGTTNYVKLEKVINGTLNNNKIDVYSFAALLTDDCEDITVNGGSIRNTKNGNGLIRISSDSSNYRIINTVFYNSAGQLPIRLDGGSTEEPTLINVPRYNGGTFDKVLGEINRGPTISDSSVLYLDNRDGHLNSMNSARSSGAYFISGGTSGGVPNGWSKTLINTGTEPTVDAGAVKIKGDTFIASTDMYLMVRDNGVRIEYYFIEI